MFSVLARLRDFVRPGLCFASPLLVLLVFPAYSEAGQPTPDEAPAPIAPPDYGDTSLSADDVDHNVPRPSYARGMEWVGMSFGGQFLFEHAEYSADHGGAASRRLEFALLKADLLLLNLYADNFYMTFLELHPTFVIGLLGGGLRVGYRMPVEPDFRQELRVGSYLGLDTAFVRSVRYGINLMPHFQYIWNMSQFSVGFGLDVPIIFLLTRRVQGYDGHDDTLSPVMGGVMLYFRLGFGRTLFSISERNP